MEKKNIKFYIIGIVTVLSFISVSVGATYAFFLAVGNKETTEVSIMSAEVFAVFNAEKEINDVDILPGYSNEVVFSIVNTTEVENAYGNYTLAWNIVENTINDENFVYTLTGISYRGNNNVPISDTNKLVSISGYRKVPTVSTNIGSGLINTGVTHKYTLTVKFLETGTAQNHLQGKTFNGSVIAKGDPNI